MTLPLYKPGDRVRVRDDADYVDRRGSTGEVAVVSASPHPDQEPTYDVEFLGGIVDGLWQYELEHDNSAEGR